MEGRERLREGREGVDGAVLSDMCAERLSRLAVVKSLAKAALPVWQIRRSPDYVPLARRARRCKAAEGYVREILRSRGPQSG